MRGKHSPFPNLRFMLRYVPLLRRMHRRWLSEFTLRRNIEVNGATEDQMVTWPSVRLRAAAMLKRKKSGILHAKIPSSLGSWDKCVELITCCKFKMNDRAEVFECKYFNSLRFDFTLCYRYCTMFCVIYLHDHWLILTSQCENIVGWISPMGFLVDINIWEGNIWVVYLRLLRLRTLIIIWSVFRSSNA